MAILQDLSATQMPSTQDMLAMIAKLSAENEALRKGKAQRGLSFKVSEKGAVSIYGMGRFPITLYLSQFQRLDAAWADLKAFVEANKAKLTVKE